MHQYAIVSKTNICITIVLLLKQSKHDYLYIDIASQALDRIDSMTKIASGNNPCPILMYGDKWEHGRLRKNTRDNPPIASVNNGSCIHALISQPCRDTRAPRDRSARGKLRNSAGIEWIDTRFFIGSFASLCPAYVIDHLFSCFITLKVMFGILFDVSHSYFVEFISVMIL